MYTYGRMHACNTIRCIHLHEAPLPVAAAAAERGGLYSGGGGVPGQEVTMYSRIKGKGTIKGHIRKMESSCFYLSRICSELSRTIARIYIMRQPALRSTQGLTAFQASGLRMGFQAHNA